jgi:acetoin utilization protein AcuB
VTLKFAPIDRWQLFGGKRPAFAKPHPTVADRMTRPAITIGWAEPLAAAAGLMAEHGIRHLPVVEADGRLIGILTESDVRQMLASERVRHIEDVPPTLIVGAAMSVDPVSIAPDTRLSVAVEIMYERKLSALPVVDRDAVIGIITESDILLAFRQMIERE